LGGWRPPLIVAKNSASLDDSGKPSIAFAATRQLSQLAP
jgi:hypothetical protein